MSEDKIPEWVRLKNEMISIWQGAWDAINRLDDRQKEFERRIREIENEIRSRSRWHR